MKRGFGLIFLILGVGLLAVMAVLAYTQLIPNLDVNFSKNVPAIVERIPKIASTIKPISSSTPAATTSGQPATPIVVRGFVVQNNTGCTLGTGADCYMILNGNGGISHIVYCKDDTSKTGLDINTGDQVEVKGVEAGDGQINACGSGDNYIKAL